ncbi:hypothetical protein BJF85_22125 [Saccharomonospora sp. CUA-673]|nr:hypothetical protein BJF85_22125 [Saccharomonospora sp. CUA-673]
MFAGDVPAAAPEMFEDGLECCAVDGRVDGAAVAGKLVGGKVEASAADAHAGGADLDVVGAAAASGFDDAAAVGLVGRFVLGEAHVAVGPEDLGFAEVGELVGQLGEELLHGSAHVAVVGGGVGVPIRFGVVNDQAVVEVDGVLAEAGESHGTNVGHRREVRTAAG